MAREKPAEALRTEGVRVLRAGVALDEREADWTVDVFEDHRRARPVALEFGAELVRERDPGLDQVLTRAGQRPQRLGLIAVGHQDAEAVAVGPRELAEHERVEPIRFAAGGAKPRAGGGDLVGMDRHHPQPGVQQPLDQDSVRPLDRDQRHLQTHKRVAQRDQPALVVRERRGEDSLARLVSHEQVVLLRRPINAGVVTSHLFSNSVRTSHRPDQDVPLRALSIG